MSELDDCKYTIRRSMLLLLLLLPSPRRSHDQPSHHSAVSTSTIIAEQTNCSTAPWQCQVTPRFYLYLPRISYRCQRVPRYVVTVERTRGPRETHSSRADRRDSSGARFQRSVATRQARRHYSASFLYGIRRTARAAAVNTNLHRSSFIWSLHVSPTGLFPLSICK